MYFTQKSIADDPEAFPVFNREELRLLLDAGSACNFKEGEFLVEAGERNYDCYFIINGQVKVIDVSTEEAKEVLTHNPGHFVGDLDLLTGRPAVVNLVAAKDVETACIRSADIRDLLVRHPQIGDRLVRAFLHRREQLTVTEFEGISVYGHKDCNKTLAIQEFFYRNGVPHTWKNIEDDEIADRLRGLGVSESNTPILFYGKRELFRQPSLGQLAKHIGIQRETTGAVYDTVIIGCGPSGLGAAVYASSEGLRTLIVDRIGPGGQAGSSSKIENYAGFPAGLSGRELAMRSYLQALKFGAEFVAPCSVQSFERASDGLYAVTLCTGERIATKTIVVSTGISYRSLRVDGMASLQGTGVFYNATQVEAILCKNRPVHVIGAGNSAGQAAMYLSDFCFEVNLLIRGSDIAKSMSSYLWARVLKNPKIKVRYQSEMTTVEGDQTIEAVRVLDKARGLESREVTAGVFIFIGGVPGTDFLPADIARDERGFVLAGAQVAQHPGWKEDRLPCALETSWPGVFVSGDCRSGTTKRVAFAIGDGALAVTCIHDYLGTYS
ncbi:MAG: FAD-dependent oxidoreductase [Planctomycetota bacterium]